MVHPNLIMKYKVLYIVLSLLTICGVNCRKEIPPGNLGSISCTLQIENGDTVNGLKFGDSLDKVKSTIKGEWVEVNVEKNRAISSAVTQNTGGYLKYENFIVNGIGYSFENDLLHGIYDNNHIAVCLNGRQANHLAELSQIMLANGYQLIRDSQKTDGRITQLRNDYLRIGMIEKDTGPSMIMITPILSAAQ